MTPTGQTTQRINSRAHLLVVRPTDVGRCVLATRRSLRAALRAGTAACLIAGSVLGVGCRSVPPGAGAGPDSEADGAVVASTPNVSCKKSLAGRWRHATDAAFRYRAEDDGSTVTLVLERSTLPANADGGAPDAGTASATAAASGTGPRIVLKRRGDTLAGVTRGQATNAAGQNCDVTFPTEATGCENGAFTLRSAAAVSVDAQCAPSATATAPIWVEHKLVRDTLL